MVAYRRGRPCRRVRERVRVQSLDVLHARVSTAPITGSELSSRVSCHRATDERGGRRRILDTIIGATWWQYRRVATDAQSRSEVQSPDVLRQGSSTARQITSSELSSRVSCHRATDELADHPV
jgi:hypothetical protein